MSFEAAIKVENLSKCYNIYDKPSDRLLQMFAGRRKKYFREFWALRDVSFEIRKGETVGIVGRNGSGKSTLLQLICGTTHPTNGNIVTNGRIAALLELGSGFNPEFTGRENVYLNAKVLGLTHREIEERFDAIAEFADIGDFIEQPVKTYSSGMVVRLAFAVAINVEPQLLIVDEALSVGDELFQRKCFSRIEAIKETGATILFVSHSGATVVDLCDRALLLDMGDLIATGQPKTIIAKYQKLLYAPEHKRAEVRQDILRASLSANAEPTATTMLAEKPEPHAGSGPAKSQATEEHFDEHLIPKSTISHEAYGTRIQNLRILNIAGDQVNCLIRGNTYRYCYEVVFDESVNNVRFGMLVKTITGTELGGAASAALREKTITVVKAHSIAKVEFSFRCALNGGVFFVNAGVLGTIDGEERYLCRLLDALMFRVIHNSDILSTGTVDFSPSADIEIASS